VGEQGPGGPRRHERYGRNGKAGAQVEKTRFPDGRFHSGVFGKEGSFEWTFTERGTYRHFCDVHPIMRATVIVE